MKGTFVGALEHLKLRPRPLFLLTFLVFFNTALGLQPAKTETFAALTITPNGAEVVDIATGVTTLPDGGRVIDAERGLSVESDYIRFAENDFIETKRATVTGTFGTLTAQTLYLDLKQNELKAQGEVLFGSANAKKTTGQDAAGSSLQVSADSLTLFLDAEVVRLAGHVTSDNPSFETDALLLDLAQNRPGALLVSPYTFENGPFTLQQSAAGNLLELRRDTLADGSSAYNPTTEVEAGLLHTLQPYLP